MKFFIPHAETEAEAEEEYQAIRKFAKETTGWEIIDRRIESLEFSTEYRYTTIAKVGKMLDTNHEEVIVILESTTYLVCTHNRGALRGMPILVGKNEVLWVRDFN